MEGHLNAYGASFNIRALIRFVDEVKGLGLKSLRRRSQRHRMNGSCFGRLCEDEIPSPRIMHPLSDVKLPYQIPEAGVGCVSSARLDLHGGPATAIPTATTKAECLVGLLTGKTVAQASFLAGKVVVLPLSGGLTPSGHIAGGRATHFYPYAY